MQLFSILSFASVALATRVAWDAGYDGAGRTLDDVSCSNGENGLETQHPGWTTLGNVPTFPNIGAFQAVEGWNSVSVSYDFDFSCMITNSLIVWDMLADNIRKHIDVCHGG
jgi:hypothetical protein